MRIASNGRILFPVKSVISNDGVTINTFTIYDPDTMSDTVYTAGDINAWVGFTIYVKYTAASIVTYLPAGYAAVGVADSTFYVQEPAKVVNPLVAGGAEIMDSILPVEGYIIATKE